MVKSNFIVVVVVLAAGFLYAQSPAQKKAARANPASAYKLVRIKISGSTRYTPEQMLAFSGLRIGDNVTDENFKVVSEKLGETGLFTNVAYGFTFSPAGTEVEFELADNNKLVPAAFENFVWFPDDELRQKLAASVPLFQAQLPLDGTLIDTVADALQAFLAQRNVENAKVEIMRHADEEGPIDSIVYSVSGLNIHIRNVEFPGAGESERPQLAEAAKREQGDEYLRSKLRILARMDLMPIYLREGKLRAKFADSQARIVKEEKQEVQVDAVVPVEEGRQYKLGAIEWTGNKLFPTAKLAPAVHLQPGQVLDAVQLKADLDKVNQIYRTKGYIKASVEPEVEFNDAEGSASYKLKVNEGDQYKMGEVDLEGLDEKNKVRVQEAWTLREGEPYDGSYAKSFLKSLKDVLPNLNWRMQVHESINESDKSVDVSLHFTIDAPR
jgi:outer membrane protein insertion porin family